MDYILNVNQLTKSYGNLKAVDDLNIHLKEGEVFGLLGPNGAGKTTSIECILGTKTFDTGRVSILGLHPKSDRKELFEHVGVQFQEAKYQEHIRVIELCQVTASLYQNSADYSALLKKIQSRRKNLALISKIYLGAKSNDSSLFSHSFQARALCFLMS